MFASRIPISYNIRSIRARFTSTIVAVLGIAGVVAVFLAMLAMVNGFQSVMVSTVSPDNAMIRRAGSGSEMESLFMLEELRIIQDLPEVAQNAEGKPIYSGDVVVVVPLLMRSTGTEANVQMRGISGNTLEVRPQVRMIEGRFIEPGKAEVIVGSGAHKLYQGTELGSELAIGGRVWTVVGVFDAGGSSLDSELWSDAILTNETFNRPPNIFQSVTLKLNPGVDIKAFDTQLRSDPRLTVSAQSEVEYYSEKSEMISRLITKLGFLIVFVMGFGAVFASLNTMASLISARNREIGTLRAIGFKRRNIILSFVLESVFIALIGGLLGCLLVLPLNGFQASTMNWDTFSHIGFSLKLNLTMILSALGFAVAMGFIGGIIPAAHAANRPIVDSLRRM
ncbi:MAG: ABC transporter permease [Opitutales bacterium]|nr:ABC transporter permease [Opitutales bacterium]